MSDPEGEQLQRLQTKTIEAMKGWMAEEVKTQKLSVEIGGHLNTAKSEQVRRQLDAEEQALVRYEEAQQEYEKYMRGNKSL
jgi:hypothetical protein